MNGTELLRGVDHVAREREIPKESILAGIEKAVRLAITKRFDDEEPVEVTIDRTSGVMTATRAGQVMEPETLGRIAAAAAKQFLIQCFKEYESDHVFDLYAAQKGQLVHGTVQRYEGGNATVALGKAEAFMPRRETIPGETHHVGERIKAVILNVERAGHRVKITLSRTHPDFVRRLFEEEIPEIEDQTITIKAVAREAGYRTKVAVSSIDSKVDCVGACVGVRGSRIKNIVDELGGERIDIVRWNDALQVLIPNALQPAAIEEVFLYPRLGRAIVLVKEDQLSLAIGRRGQNVRLASKLVGWDIEIMTHDELNDGIVRAEDWFRQIPNVTDEMVERFIEEGFLSYNDLTFLEPAELGELSGIDEDAAMDLIDFAEERAEQVEEETRQAKAAGEVPAGRGSLTAPAPRPTPAEQVARLFADTEPPPEAPAEVKPTVESLFGPSEPAPAPAPEEPRPEEPPLSTAQVAAEEAPPEEAPAPPPAE
jgi:transcription termination/antitermination protein NusA